MIIYIFSKEINNASLKPFLWNTYSEFTKVTDIPIRSTHFVGFHSTYKSKRLQFLGNLHFDIFLPLKFLQKNGNDKEHFFLVVGLN